MRVYGPGGPAAPPRGRYDRAVPEDTPLFDFSDPARSGGFASIDDVVMGGRSSSRASCRDAALVFEGEVSLEQGGGFASIRSAPAPLPLAGALGLALRLLGDGHRYKLNLRCDDALDGVTWQADFATTPGDWQELLLPFDRFRPTWRGREVTGAAPLDPAAVRTVGLLIGGRQAGPFRLVVAALAARRAGPGGPLEAAGGP